MHPYNRNPTNTHTLNPTRSPNTLYAALRTVRTEGLPARLQKVAPPRGHAGISAHRHYHTPSKRTEPLHLLHKREKTNPTPSIQQNKVAILVPHKRERQTLSPPSRKKKVSLLPRKREKPSPSSSSPLLPPSPPPPLASGAGFAAATAQAADKKTRQLIAKPQIAINTSTPAVSRDISKTAPGRHPPPDPPGFPLRGGHPHPPPH